MIQRQRCHLGHEWDSTETTSEGTCPRCGSLALNTVAPDQTPAFSPHPHAITPPTIPGYEIRGVLGRGGIGVVYQARQIKLNRIVALKMILAGSHASPEEQARFRAEAESVARLQHPNIMQIFDVGEHESHPYFSLEFIESGSLANRLHGTPWPPRDAARMVAQLTQP